MFKLASDVSADQTTEITRMQKMLASLTLGAARASDRRRRPHRSPSALTHLMNSMHVNPYARIPSRIVACRDAPLAAALVMAGACAQSTASHDQRRRRRPIAAAAAPSPDPRVGLKAGL